MATGTPVLGKDMLVSVHDGAVPGVLIEVPHQGDATYNPGKGSEISVRKNSKIPYPTDAGATISFSIVKERPALAAHTRLRTLSQTGEQASVEYADKNTGGVSHTGNAVITVGEETTGVEGVLEQAVTISFVDDPVIGNVA